MCGNCVTARKITVMLGPCYPAITWPVLYCSCLIVRRELDETTSFTFPSHIVAYFICMTHPSVRGKSLTNTTTYPTQNSAETNKPLPSNIPMHGERMYRSYYFLCCHRTDLQLKLKK